MYFFLACEWKEEGNTTGQNLSFQTKITAKLQPIPCKLINLMNCCWSFSPIWFFFVCFIQAGFAGRGFCNRSTDTALTRLSAEPWSLLEVASSPSKWEAEGNTDAGDVAPCRDSHVLQVTLHQDTEPREQPYGYGERRRRTVRRRGRSGNRKTIRKLPGNQVFSSSLGKH